MEIQKRSIVFVISLIFLSIIHISYADVTRCSFKDFNATEKISCDGDDITPIVAESDGSSATVYSDEGYEINYAIFLINLEDYEYIEFDGEVDAPDDGGELCLKLNADANYDGVYEDNVGFRCQNTNGEGYPINFVFEVRDIEEGTPLIAYLTVHGSIFFDYVGDLRGSPPIYSDEDKQDSDETSDDNTNDTVISNESENDSSADECTSGCVGQNGACIPYGVRAGDNYCDIDGELKSQKQVSETCSNDFECLVNECSNGICGTPCSGCLDSNGICNPIGTRNESHYCSVNETFIEQKTEEISCNNNFECESGICANGQCVDSTLVQRILSFFRNLFGGE